jgi:hypothetical protein
MSAVDAEIDSVLPNGRCAPWRPVLLRRDDPKRNIMNGERASAGRINLDTHFDDLNQCPWEEAGLANATPHPDILRSWDRNPASNVPSPCHSAVSLSRHPSRPSRPSTLHILDPSKGPLESCVIKSRESATPRPSNHMQAVPSPQTPNPASLSWGYRLH